MHIAIVDDLESDRCSLGDLLERYFESVGMDLAMDVYESGEAFLQRTTDSEYDLVFFGYFYERTDRYGSGETDGSRWQPVSCDLSYYQYGLCAGGI